VAADKAVTDLRTDRKPVDDFKNLRSEVMDLEKANRSLRKELDDLKKKVDAENIAAVPGAPAGSDKKRKKVKDGDAIKTPGATAHVSG
jgi:hypothetical protein